MSCSGERGFFCDDHLTLGHEAVQEPLGAQPVLAVEHGAPGAGPIREHRMRRRLLERYLALPEQEPPNRPEEAVVVPPLDGETGAAEELGKLLSLEDADVV